MSTIGNVRYTMLQFKRQKFCLTYLIIYIYIFTKKPPIVLLLANDNINDLVFLCLTMNLYTCTLVL